MRWFLVALVVALLAGGCWLGLRAVQAQQALQEARSSLELTRTAVAQQDASAAQADLVRAGRATQRARALTGDPLWRAVAAVPYAGASFAAARGVAVAADDVARQVLPPTVAATRMLKGGSLRRADGAVDLTALATATAQVRFSQRRLLSVQRDLMRLPRSGVVGAVAHGRRQLTQQASTLASLYDEATKALALLPPLLGADRPRRYFVLVQQPGESRGTGGIPGGFAILQASSGRLTVVGQGSNADLRQGPIPVPKGVPADYVDNYAYNGAFKIWQNVNLSPDLPVVARVVAARWAAQGGGHVDGVIALDPAALADLLHGSPPLLVAGGRRVPISGLVDYLGVEQYRDFPATASLARKDNLVGVARAAADRLTGHGGSTAALLTGVMDAVRSGHLRMASDDPALAGGLTAAGVTGALPQGSAPVAYAVVNNSSEGKLDYFLDRTIQYQAGVCAGGRRASTIRVDLRNSAPARGLPPYLTLLNDYRGKHQSYDGGVLLTIYGTRGARLVSATMNGVPLLTTAPPHQSVPLESGVEDGLPFWLLYVPLPRLRDQVVALHLDEPAVAGAVRMPEQPLTRPAVKTSIVSGCS